MKYEIDMTCVVMKTATVIIDADNEEEAREIAAREDFDDNALLEEWTEIWQK